MILPKRVQKFSFTLLNQNHNIFCDDQNNFNEGVVKNKFKTKQIF